MTRMLLILAIVAFSVMSILLLIKREEVPSDATEPLTSTNLSVQAPTDSSSREPNDEAHAQSLSADQALHEEDLVTLEGQVIREWGSFIPAKDIRANCREADVLVSHDPNNAETRIECDTRTEFEHPYSGFTDSQLRQIADSDAEAAYLLAFRLLLQPNQGVRIDESLDDALTFAMFAFIESGEKQAFDLLIDGRSFRNWDVWSTTNGSPTPEQVGEKEEEYVWRKAGQDIGVYGQEDPRWIIVQQEMNAYKDYFDFDSLNEKAQQIAKGVIDQRSRISRKPHS